MTHLYSKTEAVQRTAELASEYLAINGYTGNSFKDMEASLDYAQAIVMAEIGDAAVRRNPDNPWGGIAMAGLISKDRIEEVKGWAGEDYQATMFNLLEMELRVATVEHINA